MHVGHQEATGNSFQGLLPYWHGRDERKNKGIDWGKQNRHNGRRGCKATAAYISAHFPLLRPLLLLLQVYMGTPSPHDCSGTNQTIRITHVSKACRPKLLNAAHTQVCSSQPWHSHLHSLEMGRGVFFRALSFSAAVTRLMGAVFWPSDPQHALGWKVLCSLSQFCLSLWQTDILRS